MGGISGLGNGVSEGVPIRLSEENQYIGLIREKDLSGMTEWRWVEGAAGLEQSKLC